MSSIDDKWDELVEKYGDNIPWDEHHAFIDDESLRSYLNGKIDDKLVDDKLDEEGLKDYLEFMSRRPFFRATRARVRSDLFWLARYFLWETNPESAGKGFEGNNIIERVHGKVCELFVKKDNSKGIGEQDLVCKERLILYPRGSMKSTIDVCDTVQWILNFPEIRILFLTAADDLAVGFVNETKGHFVMRTERSLMNLYFPEFCSDEKELGKETAFEFTCPVWKRQSIRRKEATVTATSITSNLSGPHFEVIKADDVVSNRNSENEEMCGKVTKRINVSVRKMLRPYGYFDVIGTRYADEDYYGELIEKNVGDIRKTKGLCYDLIENLTNGLKILVGRAWELKSDVVSELEKGTIRPEEIGEAHYDLLFPESLSYSYLRQEQQRDEVAFEGQYNQNPRPASATPFTRALLLKATVPFQEMPFRGPTSQTWDFAFSKKKGRDYSTAACALWNDKGQAFILDLVRGRFHHADLAKAVVEFAQKWRPFVIGIEDAAGSKFLEPTIISEAQRTGNPDVIAVCSKIDWISPEQQKDAKKMRMAALHPWLVNDRLKFAAYLPHLEALYSEFERCLTSHHHDDIPDVISRQVRYAPSILQMIAADDLQTISRADVAWHMLYEEGYVGPSYGWLLSHDPVSGELRWNAPPIQDPILNPEPVDLGPPAETPVPGLSAILGGGVCG